MGVKEFELFHGSVLAQLIRNGQPISLKLIEMRVDWSRSAYLINDSTYFYIKHSKSPKVSNKCKDILVWSFTFMTEHLEEMLELRREKDLCLILVCGQAEINRSTPIETCFLDWGQVDSCFDFCTPVMQTVKVKYQKHHKMRVWGPKNTMHAPILVNQNALAQWKAPGS